MSQVFGHEKQYKKIIVRIITLFVAFNLLVASVLYYLHIRNQKEELANKISSKCLALGSAMIETFESTIELGIPLNKFKGVEEYLSNKLDSTAELDYIVITDSNGKLLYEASDKNIDINDNTKEAFIKIADEAKNSSIPFSLKLQKQINFPVEIKLNDKTEGFINIGLSRKEINNRVLAILFDIAMIVVASLIIGYEFISYLFLNAIVYPFRNLFSCLNLLVKRKFKNTHQPSSNDGIDIIVNELNNMIVWLTERFALVKQTMEKLSSTSSTLFNALHTQYIWPVANQPRIIQANPIVYNIRLIAFLFVLAEATIMPHIPAHAMRFYSPDFILSKSMLGSLPVFIFMIAATIGIFANTHLKLASKFGYKKIIISSSIISSIGYISLALYESLYGLLIARFVIGIGFSLCYVSYQGFVNQYSSDDEKLSASVIFLIAMGAGYMCGSPIGGVIIDNLGFKFAALIPFAAILLSAVFVKKYITEPPYRQDVNNTKPIPLIMVIKEKSIFYPVIFSGFPIRFLYSAMLCFLYPLYLQSLGNSEAMIGRIMMIFGTLMFVFGSLSPIIIKKSDSRKIAIISSLALGCFLLLDKFMRSTLGVAISVGIYTICSTIHTTAILSILNEESNRLSNKLTKESIFGFYFLLERIAMIFGAPATAFLLKFTEYSQALFAIGIFVIINSVVFYCYQRSSNKNMKAVSP